MSLFSNHLTCIGCRQRQLSFIFQQNMQSELKRESWSSHLLQKEMMWFDVLMIFKFIFPAFAIRTLVSINEIDFLTLNTLVSQKIKLSFVVFFVLFNFAASNTANWLLHKNWIRKLQISKESNLTTWKRRFFTKRIT